MERAGTLARERREMRRRAVAGIGAQSHRRDRASPSRCIMRSRTTFATMEAAAIEAIVASPLTTASTVQGRCGGSLPSTSAMSGVQGKRGERPAHGEERGLADVDGIDLVVRDRARCRHAAVARISANSASRRAAVRAFESARPCGHALQIEHDGGRDDRPRERPAADLVEPRDAAVAACARRSLAVEAEAGRRVMRIGAVMGADESANRRFVMTSRCLSPTVILGSR